MLVRIAVYKHALVQKTFAVPDIVGDLRLLLIGGQLPVLQFNRNNIFNKRAFIVGNEENTVQRNFYRAFDTAER